MSRSGRFCFLFPAVFLVAGCVSAPDEDPALGALAASPPPKTSGVETPLNPTPEPVSTTPSVAGPDALLGLEPREIQALLGPVSLKRWEGEGQVMQFTNRQCVMDIYFYESEPGGAFQATYLSARTKMGADFDPASCLASLLPN
ncbi:MAG: hypothetical protein V3R20_03445 [Sphingomonadales bacterium]